MSPAKNKETIKDQMNNLFSKYKTKSLSEKKMITLINVMFEHVKHETENEINMPVELFNVS
jgi:hypothetical protein